MRQNKLILFFFLFYCLKSTAGGLSLEWQHYLSAPSLESQKIDYIFFKGEKKKDWSKGPFYFDSHFQTEYSLNKDKTFRFNIPELYFSYKYKLKQPLYSIKSLTLDMGRKIKEWSLADEYWDMGLWNALSLWNPLHPATSGLIGSFLNLTAKQWSADLLLGALYLPHQETKLIRENGDIYSHSRWFSPLPNQVESLNIDIHYFTRAPFLLDILFRQSYLLSFKTWSQTKNTHYWIKWAIADKPANHLFYVLNKENLFTVGKEKGAVGQVNQQISVLPVRQRILSLEWGLNYNNLSAVFTLENIKTKETETKPESWDFVNHRENFTYFSALLKYNFSAGSARHFIQTAYIQPWFQDQNINSKDLTKQKPPAILQRYKVLEGLGFDWSAKFLSSKGLLRSLSLSWRYSFLNKGAWLSAKGSYHITPKISALASLDILGAENNKTYFLNRFRHNDYFSWSIVYDL